MIAAATDPIGFGEPFATGDSILDDVHAAFCRFVAFPSPQAADAAVLWTAATHAMPVWQHAPRLVARSPQKRCGKSRLMDVIGETCRKPLLTVNASVNAIFRSIGEDPPTLLVDEADTLFGTKRAAENNEDLRGLINAGHQRGRTALRCDGPKHKPKEFATFSMVMLASIGALPDTIEDRAVVIRMRRRAPGERVAPFRTRRDQPALNRLREDLAEWIAEYRDELGDAEPAMDLEDRQADTWEPLIAVGDLAGGDWPARARNAAAFLCAEAVTADAEATLSITLLADIKGLFEDFTIGFMPSQELVNRLCKLEDSPWREDFLSTMKLAAMLREFGIKPRRNSAGDQRGYRFEDFTDTLRRYLRQDPSDGVKTAPDLQERSDTLKSSDGLTRQTVRSVSALTSTSDNLTPPDGGTACSGCGGEVPGFRLRLGRSICMACEAAS